MGLKFYLLGPPQITWNDSLLDIPRRQVRILLYYLASYPNVVPQERLHYLFWKEKTETTCRRNLSHLLTHARSTLPDKDILVVKDSMVTLDQQKIWCDVVEFKGLIHSTPKDMRADVYRRAVNLYRGDFLDGLQFSNENELESLIEMERFNLERNYLNLLYKLILIEKQDGNNEAAIEYAYQYLNVDNLSEEVHRQLIILHGLTGNRERALSQYRICEELLQRELQTKPSIKTQLAYQHVLIDSTSGRNNILINESVDTRLVKIEPLYVNSDSYNRFIRLFDSVRVSDHGGVALLYGELGIGKSSLLTKALSKIGKNSLIIRTHCDPGVRSLSYWPIKSLLSKEFRSRPSIKAAVADCFDNEPAPLDTAHGNTSDITSNILAKDNCFASLVNCIVSLTDEPGGLTLCIEDLEWADPDTLDLILYLSRYTPQKKLWFVGSYCCLKNEKLVDFLHKLQLTEGYTGTVHVQGMSQKEVSAMVKLWLGDLRIVPTLARRLHHLSGGNPFFVSEILGWVTESGISTKELLNGKTLSLPPTISKTIDYRLGLLSQIERRVLEVGAAIGFIFKVDQVSELSDLPVMQILDALDELVNRHFLLPRSSQYQFAHELVRQLVLDKMSPARRKFLKDGCLGN